MQLSVRSIYVETTFVVQARKEICKRVPDEALNESVGILNRDTGSNCRRSSTTSTARKQLIIDTVNPAELYAWSKITEEGVVGEGKMTRTDSKVENGCVEGNINSRFGEFSIALHHGHHCCHLLFMVEIFTGIPVLTFMLQRWVGSMHRCSSEVGSWNFPHALFHSSYSLGLTKVK